MNILKIIFIVFFCVSLCNSWQLNYNNSQHYENIRRQIFEQESNKVTTDASPTHKVKIKVYYESLCPGSINFVTNHLRPAVEKLGSYLDVHLVPYGHAKTRELNGQYSFECQHGPEECFGNRLHACAVDVMRNSTKAVFFNACLMEYTKFRRSPGFDYAVVVNWCNYKQNSRTDGIWTCVHGDRSATLLKSYGEETRAVRTPYVPYVIVGDGTDDQDDRGDLVSMICQKLDPAPPPCEAWRRIY